MTTNQHWSWCNNNNNNNTKNDNNNDDDNAYNRDLDIHIVWYDQGVTMMPWMRCISGMSSDLSKLHT